MFRLKAIHDLTVPLETYMPLWPTNPLLEIKPIGTVARDGYKIEMMSGVTHSGTHIDAPAHMIEDGSTIDEIDPNRFVGTGYCLKIIPDGHHIRSTHLLEKWRDEYDGSIILLETGWYKKRGFTREFQYEFPGLTEDAAEFLIERKVKLIGIDTLGIEPYEGTDFRVHKKLLSKGIPFIEDLYGLDDLEEGKPYFIVALPLKIRGASGSMARVIALEVD
ncbi:cyclase family protein [Thermoplasma sp.]|uniref:cyclase family protein n=1 Tax=Thermoplasma sp. TaxID=1973142 RepID=UPI0025E5AA75|nr:cyclase family protein [Thermoplasma sp.]